MRGRNARRELEKYTNWIKRTGKLPCMKLQHGSIRPSEGAIWQMRHRPYETKGEMHEQ